MLPANLSLEPLSALLGGETGVITDFDGNFTLSVNPGTTLQISYIGYETQEVTATKNVVVILQEDAGQKLNEVVVIGYGRAKKSDLTGSVTAIKPDEMNHGLVTSAQDALQGRIAGVNITTSGGEPGADATIRIRGGSSLNASNNPLIVIDGWQWTAMVFREHPTRCRWSILTTLNPLPF